MTAPLYNYLEGMGKSRQQPGGYTTMRPGTGGAGGRQFGGLAGTLSRLASGRGGGRPAVYQPITPVMSDKYSGKASGVAGIGFALKGIANVMQAIENYKAAQLMQQMAIEKHDEELASKAIELRNQSLTAMRPFIEEFGKTLGEAPEEEREGLIQGFVSGSPEDVRSFLEPMLRGMANVPTELETYEGKTKIDVGAKKEVLGEEYGLKGELQESEYGLKEKLAGTQAGLEKGLMEKKHRDTMEEDVLKGTLTDINIRTKGEIDKEIQQINNELKMNIEKYKGGIRKEIAADEIKANEELLKRKHELEVEQMREEYGLKTDLEMNKIKTKAKYGGEDGLTPSKVIGNIMGKFQRGEEISQREYILASDEIKTGNISPSEAIRVMTFIQDWKWQNPNKDNPLIDVEEDLNKIIAGGVKPQTPEDMKRKALTEGWPQEKLREELLKSFPDKFKEGSK